MPKNILLTGGAGFIGSHTYVALVDAGYDVTILDNFENAQRDVPDRLTQISGKQTPVIEADVRDIETMMKILRGARFDAVVHFAARKSVPEGESDPIGYYQSNCTGLFTLLAAMRAHDVRMLVFSSSAAVYGNAGQGPNTERDPVLPNNVYAATKAIGEDFLKSVSRADPEFRPGILRYFNPVGAHPSGLIGEDPSQPPTNLVPVIARVANGDLSELSIYGGDYQTPDGTGIRDYIHVQDLARGHVLSLDSLFETGKGHLVNLGTGQGYSVLEVLRAYEKVLGRPLPYKIIDRRPGDAAVCYADVTYARQILGFKSEHDLASMCESNWAYSGRKG